MSRLNPHSQAVRPLSFTYSDDLAFTGRGSPSPSPRQVPDESSRLAHPTPSPRWSGTITPEFTSVDDSRNGSNENNEKKKGPLVTIEYKGTRALTGLSDISKSATGERPKVAIKPGLRNNWKKIAPHIVAASITVAVCQLSFRDVYWMDLRPPNQLVALNLTQGGALNALQLAAKLHELIILASISSIVLHAVQHHLNGVNGLPLGMITNAFELGSGQFLRRGSFWSSLWRVDPVTGKRSRWLSFWLLSLFSTILVTLAGPSSAIAVIPTLGYFDLHHPFNEIILPYFIFNETMPLWPTALTNASLNAIGTACNDPTNLPSQNVCPAGGFRDTYDWAEAIWFGDSDAGTNISFPDPTGTTQRIITAQSCNSTYSGRASAIGINAFISSALTTYWVFLQRNARGVALTASQPRISVDSATDTFAPRVEVICNSYNNAAFDAQNPDNQTTMMFPVFGDGDPIPVPDEYYKYARPMTAQNFTFVELQRTDPLTPSLGAVVVIPIIAESINGSYYQSTENVACSIYSQWIPVDVWYEPTVNNVVSYDVAANLNDTCLNIANDPTSTRQPISNTIDAVYAAAINEPIAFTNGDVPALLAMYQRYIFNDSTFIPNGIDFRAPIPGIATLNLTLGLATETPLQGQRQRGKLIATVIAGAVGDGLARVAGNGQLPYSGSAFLLPDLTADGSLQGRFPLSTAIGGDDIPLNATAGAEKDWLSLNPTFQRYGYGYHWRGSRTTQFGISVLLIHIAVAIVHTIVVISNVTGKHGGLPCAPENIPEMVALAINSRSSARLRNTCAGIGKSRTWGEPLAVRETSEGHLEFVVGGREMMEFEVPKVGVAYGALPEGSGGEEMRKRWVDVCRQVSFYLDIFI
ncbi:uncharacterized protein LY89DRAFT_23759 [Mollisia scopiformis]|uniref:Uncharacterized protein n=1 Tax=Mollisia scopiformis TaxID=149040 RepID=A0A194XW86_MOLSC|nr:uncharacterized protein LY89DRAFT_23759 [Mollisia scopiformis]KUJ24498.1 hypothetical protein LY89DRAFT_23759 [Mollisia scopiformis]